MRMLVDVAVNNMSPSIYTLGAVRAGGKHLNYILGIITMVSVTVHVYCGPRLLCSV